MASRLPKACITNWVVPLRKMRWRRKGISQPLALPFAAIPPKPVSQQTKWGRGPTVPAGPGQSPGLSLPLQRSSSQPSLQPRHAEIEEGAQFQGQHAFRGVDQAYWQRGWFHAERDDRELFGLHRIGDQVRKYAGDADIVYCGVHRGGYVVDHKPRAYAHAFALKLPAIGLHEGEERYAIVGYQILHRAGHAAGGEIGGAGA